MSIGEAEAAHDAAEAAYLVAVLAAERLRASGVGDDEVRYALEYLGRARTFVNCLAAEGRGLAYLIG